MFKDLINRIKVIFLLIKKNSALNIVLSFINKNKTLSDDWIVGVMVRDEADYIEEFINHYIKQGVDNIVIYNNESIDCIEKKIDKFACVTLINWPTLHQDTQIAALEHFVSKFQNENVWLSFLDIDEFMFTEDIKLKEHLKNINPNITLIKVPWIVMSSIGLSNTNTNEITQRYIYRPKSTAEKEIKKYISKTKWIMRSGDVEQLHIHHPIMKKGLVIYDFSKIVIFHYMYRGEIDYMRKIQRLNKNVFVKHGIEERKKYLETTYLYTKSTDIIETRLVRKKNV
jgi:hypothetical protein